MTTFISWTSIDSRAPAGLYFASDSRINWGKPMRWNAGRKLFACRDHPDIFAYVGEAFFPSTVLGQIVEAIDHGALFSGTEDSTQKHSKIVAQIQRSFVERQNVPDYDFTIMHGSRDGVGGACKFSVWKTDYLKNIRDWRDKSEVVPTVESEIILALGTGAKVAQIHQRQWKESPQGRTSRAIFSAFCDALRGEGDVFSGGAPQLVGIYPRWNAQAFGVGYNGRRYLNGMPLMDIENGQSIEWRDELFQRVDGQSLKLLSGAQRHARVNI